MTTDTTTAGATAVGVGRAPRAGHVHGWHAHPAVRTKDQLTLGERAADRMRNGMGSWGFVFGALTFLALWMVYNGISSGSAYDKYPFILLNLLLSCLAAMQGAILLIAAKRSDQVASELAEHDYETDCRAEQLIETLTRNLAELHEEHRQMRAQLVAITRLLDRPSAG
jgi:uncharacterized membrane protein